MVSPLRHDGVTLASDLRRGFLAANRMEKPLRDRTDVVLSCQGYRFYVDGVILASRSAYFETLLSLDCNVFRDKSKANEIAFNQFKPNIVGLLLEYLYSNRPDFGYLSGDYAEEVLELLDATTMLLLQGKSRRMFQTRNLNTLCIFDV